MRPTGRQTYRQAGRPRHVSGAGRQTDKQRDTTIVRQASRKASR